MTSGLGIALGFRSAETSSRTLFYVQYVVNVGRRDVTSMMSGRDRYLGCTSEFHEDKNSQAEGTVSFAAKLAFLAPFFVSVVVSIIITTSAV